jgi:hypothetical protein
MNQHCSQLENDVATRCIVGTAEWATEHLGGMWHDSPKTGPGWTYHGGDDWRPPQPAPDCVWDAATHAWDCPPEPEPPDA